MPAPGFRTVTSPYCALAAENVDTDQIIPARFLVTTERTGLGRHAFHDWRYVADGSPNPAFPLNSPVAASAHILVAGRNFGCGSSREHAVWALLDAGFRAVVSPQFADIFRGNALGNGLLPVQVPADVVAELLERGRTSPGDALTIDLPTQQLTLPDGRSVGFPVEPFAKHRLLHGIDEMDFILDASADIQAYETRRPAEAFSTRTPAAIR